MSLSISIEFKPATPARRDTTTAIATALRTLKATPKDEAGNPGSFLIPTKHISAARAAASDVGVTIKCRAEPGTLDQTRITLK